MPFGSLGALVKEKRFEMCRSKRILYPNLKLGGIDREKVVL